MTIGKWCSRQKGQVRPCVMHVLTFFARQRVISAAKTLPVQYSDQVLFHIQLTSCNQQKAF